MSHQALALKYRPRRFEDLIGQDSVSRTLAMALDQDRLGHAYLFSGLRGSGKTSTARIFAKALLCEQGPTSKPCDTCEQCTMANEGRHIDIIEMDAASSRKIDDIRDLIEHTKYKPSVGRYKVFIIDEVHMLTTQAFNALLKTLEEPPDFVKFILATTDPLKLPATILSRTQHFRFKKIPQKLVLNHLQHILNLEEVEYDNDALDIIARSGAGSLRDSLTLLDQAIVYSKNHVDIETVTNMLGIIEPSLLDTLLDHIQNKDEANILAFIQQASAYEAEMIIDELTLHLKTMLLERDPRFSPMIIDRFFRTLADAKEMLGMGSDGEFVLSLTLFKMVEALQIRDIDAMIHTLQKELSGVKVPEQKASKPAQEPAPVTPAKPAETKKIKETSVSPEAALLPDKPEQPIETPATPEPVAEPAPPSTEPEQTSQLRFKSLMEKIYDRDYDLGSCFERNITFDHFRDHTLTWISTAEGDDKKTLIQGWSIIKMFVQEIFGFETKIVNVPSTEPKKKTNLPVAEPTPAPTEPPEVGSMIEAIELPDDPNSCINPDPGTTEASREKDPSTLLQEPMVKEMIELFQPKKVRIVRKS